MTYWFMQCSILPLALLSAALTVTACGQAPSGGKGSGTTPISGAVADSAEPFAPGLDIGMWVWHREEVVVAAERERLIEFCQTYGITKIFVQVRFDPVPGGYTFATPDAWRALLDKAHAAGVQVEALDGGNAMAFEENRADTLAKLDAVLAFHRAQPAGRGFAGIRYDIEPYTSARWRDGDVAAVMQEFLVTIEQLRDAVRAADPALTIAHDIPFFYDGQERYLLTYGGETKNFHRHIQDLSDYVGVMSYRTRATGPNSVTSISEGELAYGREIGRPVYLSLETVPLSDTPQITFYGRTPQEFRATIKEVREHLADEPAFGGLLLHQYRTIRALLEGTPVPPRR